MKLNNVELVRLLPFFMRDDKNFKALCKVMDEAFAKLYGYTDLIRLSMNIDILPDEILNELAWHFNILEYNVEYDIEAKRRLIKDCLSIHHKRGTVAAVEEVGAKIFGSTRVEEWFDYEDEGEPYHFRVHTQNISTSEDMIREFERVVVSAQNIRSWLDEIIAETINEMPLYFGCAAHYTDEDEFATAEFNPETVITDVFYVAEGELFYNKNTQNSLVLKDREDGKIYYCYYDEGMNGRVTFQMVDGDIDYIEIAQIYNEDLSKTYALFMAGGQLYYYEV